MENKMKQRAWAFIETTQDPQGAATDTLVRILLDKTKAEEMLLGFKKFMPGYSHSIQEVVVLDKEDYDNMAAICTAVRAVLEDSTILTGDDYTLRWNKVSELYKAYAAYNPEQKFCDFCTCGDCQFGCKGLAHAKTEDGRWICSTCYNYDECVRAKRKEGRCGGPCDESNCPHRPKLVTEFKEEK